MQLQGKHVRVVITWSVLGQSQEAESQNDTGLAEVIKRNKEMLIVSVWGSQECHWGVLSPLLTGKERIIDYKKASISNCSLDYYFLNTNNCKRLLNVIIVTTIEEIKRQCQKVIDWGE